MNSGFSIGRLYVSLFNYDEFCGFWLSLGYEANYNCIVLQIQIAWLQLQIGWDL